MEHLKDLRKPRKSCSEKGLNNLYISSLSSTKTKVCDSVLDLVQLGFRNIELTGGTQYYEGLEVDLVNLKQGHGINYLIHNYFPPPKEDFILNLASSAPDLKDKTVELIANATRLAEKLESNLYTVHPGFTRDLLPEKDGIFFRAINSNGSNKNIKEDFYRGMDFLLYEVLRQDFKIGIENLFPINTSERYSFIVSPDEIFEFFDYYKDRPNVGLLLDLGHLNLASKTLGFNKLNALEEIFTKYTNKIFGIHVSENDGTTDSHDVSSCESWQIEYLCQRIDRLKEVPIVMEWHNKASKQAHRTFEKIREKLKR
ncbi:MAG: TIM barrel protein [Candidatus Brocadiales bacterium]|nr:TIM barrel protein [Candidatus Brocadiales bacterium]